MSALTDIFTALANKIRSKTGTQTTYTPAQMVSDGIDDVYDAGYAAGGGGSSATPITPSNSSPASMTAGTAYEPTTNGVAIESYLSVTPKNTIPESLTSGSIYKMEGAGKAVASVTDITPNNTTPESLSSGDIYKSGARGYAIASYQTITPTSSGTDISSGEIVKFSAAGTILGSVETIIPAADGTSFSSGYKYMSDGGYAYTTQQTSTSITPSNTSPAYMSANTKYTPTAAGYAISSYSSASVTPTTSGTAFSSGWNRMTSFGYAYSSQPTTVTTTPLWTNSSPNGTFAAQTITLSSSMANYDEIKITFQGPVVTEYPNTTSYNVFPVSLITASQNANASFCAILGGYRRTSTQRIRRVTFVSNTQISISLAYMINSNDSGANNMIVPTSVVGIKYN